MSNNLKTWKSSLKEAHTKFNAINPEKAHSELGFAMQIFQNSPNLQKCDPQSILNAVVNVARTSVTLNPVMKLAYLVPRKGKCVLDFSYMGLVAMLRDNNCIRSISAHIVYEDEEFDYDVAYNKITHKPRYAKTEQEHKSRSRIGCYSRATLPNGEVVFEFMPMWEIDKVKSLSFGSSDKNSAWQTWEDEMIKKVVIKRHFKMLISINATEALSTALQIEHENNHLEGLGNNGFGDKPLISAPATNISSLFDDFDEDKDEKNDGGGGVASNKQPAVANPAPSSEPVIDFTDDEIDAFLNEEAMKINGSSDTSTEEKSSFDAKTPTIDLFAEDAKLEEEDEQDQNWFPTPKGE